MVAQGPPSVDRSTGQGGQGPGGAPGGVRGSLPCLSEDSGSYGASCRTGVPRGAPHGKEGLPCPQPVPGNWSTWSGQSSCPGLTFLRLGVTSKQTNKPMRGTHWSHKGRKWGDVCGWGASCSESGDRDAGRPREERARPQEERAEGRPSGARGWSQVSKQAWAVGEGRAEAGGRVHACVVCWLQLAPCGVSPSPQHPHTPCLVLVPRGKAGRRAGGRRGPGLPGSLPEGAEGAGPAGPGRGPQACLYRGPYSHIYKLLLENGASFSACPDGGLRAGARL